jgi:hypothetical protein
MERHIMTENTSTELAVIDTVSSTSLDRTLHGLNAAQGVNNGSQFFSTLQGGDRDTKLAVLAAMTNSEPLTDNKNKTLWVDHVIIQPVEMADEKSGVLTLVPRIVLIDPDGKAYHAMSGGLMKSVENIFGIMGSRDQWGGPIPIIVEANKAARGTYFTAKVDLKALTSK